MINSKSTVTTKNIIHAFQNKAPHIGSTSFQQTITPEPKFKYLVTLEEDKKQGFGNTGDHKEFKQPLEDKFNCKIYFLKDNTFQIWSNKEIDTTKLINKKKANPKPPLFRGGIIKAELIK